MMAPVSFLSGSQGEQFIRSVKNHPRYRLRMIAIGSVAFGIFFNILSIAICRQHILNGLAFLPVRAFRKHLILQPTARAILM